MRLLPVSIAILSSLLFSSPSSAQTYTNCNPLTTTCPPNSALGKSVSIDFTKGQSDSFTPQGNPLYGKDGASFTVAKSGDSPQITSRWYIMFGRVDVVVKAAPGAGIVSSFVLQSDDLDEVDWEWLGAAPDEVQTNYFGKGQTTTYNRGAFHSVKGTQSGFKTYTIIWTSDQIVWQIDGTTVRALRATEANGQFPQTPMQVKIGAWSGGDSSNPQGTISWARGPTDYTKGPYSMVVQKVSITDYSTGSQYRYKTQTGNWQDIEAVGGSVNPTGNGKGGTPAISAAPEITAQATGAPIAFGGTTLYPTATNSKYTVTYTNYPGLPSGWTVTGSGKVVPPSAAPGTHRVSVTVLILSTITSIFAGGALFAQLF